MKKNNAAPKILLDSDVVRHFINGNQIQKLTAIYPKRFVMLDVVFNELCRSKQIEKTVTGFVKMFQVELLDFPVKKEIVVEYAKLKKTFGDGESACMAVAKFHQQYIASSNLKDIKAYCEEHSIVYLTTMDILLDAINGGILSEKECNVFIKDVKDKGSRLPCNTIAEYKKKKAIKK